MFQISSGWARVLELLRPSEVGSSSGTHPKPGPVSSQSRNPGVGEEAPGGVIFEGPKCLGKDFFWSFPS